MFAEALCAIKDLLGQGGFIEDPAAMEPFMTSMRNRHVRTSPLVALPNSTLQAAEIVKICSQYRLPIVPQGGNTGLVDGGIPSLHGQEILVSLSRMNTIRDIDAVGSVITAEAGVILQNLQDASHAAGFSFPLSIASQGSAQVGGLISTNAGGTAVLRYGNMRNLVLGIEVILPNGDVISNLKKLVKDNTGYNLASLFVGAEGTLGIVTAATLKLFPCLQQNLTAVLAIPKVEIALELLAAFRREADEYLTTFEIMSLEAMTLVMTQIPGSRFPGKADAPYYMLIEFGSSSPTVQLREVFERAALRALEDGKILDAVIAENTAQAKQFWHMREHISDALRRHGGGIHFDIALPLNQIAPFLNATGESIKKMDAGITLMPFGHIGDGNLHYNMYMPFGTEPQLFAAIKKRLQAIVFGEVGRRHGSISAEHGVGTERKAELIVYKSPAEMDVMRKIKHAMDPNLILNPGKIFD
jgi:FAD/FMN-containing dehydrogenase